MNNQINCAVSSLNDYYRLVAQGSIESNSVRVGHRQVEFLGKVMEGIAHDAELKKACRLDQKTDNTYQYNNGTPLQYTKLTEKVIEALKLERNSDGTNVINETDLAKIRIYLTRDISDLKKLAEADDYVKNCDSNVRRLIGFSEDAIRRIPEAIKLRMNIDYNLSVAYKVAVPMTIGADIELRFTMPSVRIIHTMLCHMRK